MDDKIVQEFKISRPTNIPEPRPTSQDIAYHCIVHDIDPSEMRKHKKYISEHLQEINDEIDHLKDVFDPQLLFCRLIAMGELKDVREIIKQGYLGKSALNKLHKRYPKEFPNIFPSDYQSEAVHINEAEGFMGFTPLIVAVEFRREDMVRLLLENKADPTLPDDNGETPQDILDQYKTNERSLKEKIQSILSGVKRASKKKKKTRKVKKKTQKRGRKKYYGIKNNKVIELYPHKIKKSIGRHKYIILWKTTKENLPGKTFHGRFYKSKEEAMKNIKQDKNKK